MANSDAGWIELMDMRPKNGESVLPRNDFVHSPSDYCDTELHQISASDSHSEQLTKLKKHFDDFGFLALPAFFSDADVSKMLAFVNEMANYDESESGTAPPYYRYYDPSVAPGSENEMHLTRIEHWMTPEIEDLVMPRRLRELCEKLMAKRSEKCDEGGGSSAFTAGEEASPSDGALNLFKEKVNYKTAHGAKPDLLHQDMAAGWRKYAENFITIGIFLDDNTDENAPVSILETGEYERDLMTNEWECLPGAEPAHYPKESGYKVVTGVAGSVVLFDAYVPHGSSANLSNKQRRNIYLTYNLATEGGPELRDQYFADKLKNYPPNNMRSDNCDYEFRV